MIISSFRHRYTEVLIGVGILGFAAHLASGQSPIVTCLDAAGLVFLCTVLWLRRRSGEAPAEGEEPHQP